MWVLVSTYPIGPFYISPISPLYDVPHPHHFPHLGLTVTNPHPVAPLGSISAGFPSWVQHWGNHVLIIFLGNHLNRKAMECPKSRASDHFLGMSTKKKCMYINIPVGEHCGTYRFLNGDEHPWTHQLFGCKHQGSRPLTFQCDPSLGWVWQNGNDMLMACYNSISSIIVPPF